MAFTFGSTGASAAAPAPAFGAFGAAAPSGGTSTFGVSAQAAGASGGFGNTAAAGGFGASSTGGFGAPSAAGFGASSAGGFGAPIAKGFGASSAAAGFGAAATGGFGASPAAGGFGASSAAGGFGASSAPGFGASTAGASAAPGGIGGFGAAAGGAFGAKPAGFGASSGAAVAAPSAMPLGGAFGAKPAAAAGTAPAASGAFAAVGGAATAQDRIENIVCPIENVQRLLLETDEKGQAVLSKEAGEVLDAMNQQIAAWSPWHPSLLAHYGKLAQSGAFKQAEQKALQLQALDAAALDKELRQLTPEALQLVKVAMMPRFDATTLQGPLGNQRTPPDVVENQFSTSDWKPLLDNPHSRFRHYVLQPLTQAQMKLPAEQRHGLNQTTASSPNDPLFQSKLQENPNPYKYCVLPIVGFHQLLRRVKMQDEKLAEQHSVLQRLEGEVNRMREFQTVQLPKMVAQRRATQVDLGRRALEVMRRLEMQRQQPTAQSSRDLQMLGERVDQAAQMLSTQLQRRLQRLEELMGELRMQDRKRLKQRPVAAATCDQEALMRLDAFLEHRKTGVAHLRDIVAKDLSDTQLMTQGANAQ